MFLISILRSVNQHVLQVANRNLVEKMLSFTATAEFGNLSAKCKSKVSMIVSIAGKVMAFSRNNYAIYF